ncbi:hypothetical protein [Candidatus Oleimmundimicrobium sp.]|uniref:hypothetical protein n=1 Tax=Candidatus Oleimmundimicrobium sp. TaxID=3060597 RepID=UPI0027267DE1|nr:hypothetical protein [Candidatus Oleimmundimicrobium sp.]MDO8885725.1 hypothetical protein [Candidatus Oleimmundimicrobium sp.]
MKACYIVYNSKEVLEKYFLTVYERFDSVIVVDGAFKDYPHQVPYSTDGTIEFLKGFENVTLVETRTAWESQAEKRSVWLDFLEDNEWFFYVDDDEELIKLNLDNLDEEKGLGCAKLNLDDNDFVVQPRFIKYEKGVRFLTHTVLEKEDKFFKDISWVSDTFNNSYRLPDYSFAATLIHHSKEKSDEVRAFRERQRKAEYKKIKEFKLKG